MSERFAKLGLIIGFQILLVSAMVGQFFSWLSLGLHQDRQPDPMTGVLLLLAPWTCGLIYYGLSSTFTGCAVALGNHWKLVRDRLGRLGWHKVWVVAALCGALLYILFERLARLG